MTSVKKTQKVTPTHLDIICSSSISYRHGGLPPDAQRRVRIAKLKWGSESVRTFLSQAYLGKAEEYFVPSLSR
jgi:hypothetical protein